MIFFKGDGQIGMAGQGTEPARAHPEPLREYPTVFYVDSVQGDDIAVYLAGWNPHEPIHLSRLSFPREYRAHVTKGQRYFAMANIGAVDAKDVDIHQMELAPDLDDF